MDYIFFHKCIVLVILHSEFSFATLYIPNDESESVDIINVDKINATIIDHNTNYLKDSGVAKNMKEHANINEKLTQKINDFKVNDNIINKLDILDVIQKFASKGNKIKHSDVLKLRTILSIVTDGNAIKSLLRSSASPNLENDLANAGDITQFIRKWDDWLTKHHTTKDNQVKFKRPKRVKVSRDLTRKLQRRLSYNPPLLRYPVKKVPKKKRIDSEKKKSTPRIRHNRLKTKRKPLMMSGLAKEHLSKKPPDYYEKRLIKKKKEAAIKESKAHKAKIEKIMKFLEPNVMSTQYIYYEIKRIEKYKEIRNKVRKMIWIMELPWYRKHNLSEKVLDCYKVHFQNKVNEMAAWDLPTNNLVQHLVVDPQNDGV